MAPLPRKLLPTCNLSRVISEVPALLSAIPPYHRGALLSCSRQLREVVHQSTQTLRVYYPATCQATDLWDGWPRLTLIIARSGMILWQESKHMQLLWSVTTKKMTLSGSGFVWEAYVVCSKAEGGQPQPQAVQSRQSAIAFSNLAKSDLRNADCITVVHNTLGVAGITVVGELWPNLTYLTLRQAVLETSAWSQVVQAFRPALVMLDVRDCKLDIDSIRSLAEVDWLSLCSLLLPFHDPSQEAEIIQIIAQASWWPRVSGLGPGCTKLEAASLQDASDVNQRFDGLLIYTSLDTGTMTISVVGKQIDSDAE